MEKLVRERLSLARGIRTVLLALVLCAQACFGFSVAGQQESTCEANGSIYYMGEWYFLDSDHCTQCECTAEGSVCARTECTSLPAACIHVSHYPTDCCPRCEKIGCEYRGVVYELGQNFQVSQCHINKHNLLERSKNVFLGLIFFFLHFFYIYFDIRL